MTMATYSLSIVVPINAKSPVVVMVLLEKVLKNVMMETLSIAMNAPMPAYLIAVVMVFY